MSATTGSAPHNQRRADRGIRPRRQLITGTNTTTGKRGVYQPLMPPSVEDGIRFGRLPVQVGALHSDLVVRVQLNRLAPFFQLADAAMNLERATDSNRDAA